MIRRLFWVTIGAVAGVTGYRRVSQLARAFQPTGRRSGRPGGRGGYRGLAIFLGDVREGMELYLNRRPGSAGPTLEGQQVRKERSGQTVAARANPGIDNAKDGR